MATKKNPSSLPANVIEEVGSDTQQTLSTRKAADSDVIIKNKRDDTFNKTVSILIDIIYGDRWDNFEIALNEVGMDSDCRETFQAYVYSMLMHGDFFNLPGAKGNRGLAIAIAQAAEHSYKEPGLFERFVMRLEEWYRTHLLPKYELDHCLLVKGNDLIDLLENIIIILESLNGSSLTETDESR